MPLDLLDALIGAFEQSAQDDPVRVAILAAHGKAFSAGHDLWQMHHATQNRDGADRLAHLFSRCATLMPLIPTLPEPVIAQVQGIATAAGCQLVAVAIWWLRRIPRALG
ncbi:MAG: enoyl-CoA hydratase-related protein [Paracoccus sp. (in: a-proteobacteria)]|nr:enoyl-CoA hydratase-related protein [Paracoccus sp. (in: a-proteobacteria)]